MKKKVLPNLNYSLQVILRDYFPKITSPLPLAHGSISFDKMSDVPKKERKGKYKEKGKDPGKISLEFGLSWMSAALTACICGVCREWMLSVLIYIQPT